MKIFFFIAFVGVIITMTGCAFLMDHRNEVHERIIEYIETKGQAEAIAYIDRMVLEGKIGASNAEKIKQAIPLGIEELKKVMNGGNNE